MVRGRVSDGSGEPALVEGDRRAHRAQLGCGYGANSWRGRSWAQSGGGDRAADRRASYGIHRGRHEMTLTDIHSTPRHVRPKRDSPGTPLFWTFDGTFARCLADAEDTLRRALVQIGDVSGVVVALDISLPSLRTRVAAGDRIQPAWGVFLERLPHHGRPAAPRARYLASRGHP